MASTPRTVNEQNRATTNNKIGQPVVEQIHIRYGKISKVSKNLLVKVILLNNNGDPDGPEIVDGKFLPVSTPMSVILHQFGPLRKNLICRIFWKGKTEPNANSVIDIIGDEEHRFLAKEPYPSEVAVGPFKIFAGGMSV